MIHLEEQIDAAGRIADVFRYVADFANIEQWDPGVISARKVTPGPVGVGTAFDLACAFFMFSFPMTYEVVAYDPPRKIVLNGRGDTIAVTDAIHFSETPNGVRIRYVLDLTAERDHPLLRALLGAYVRRIGKRAAGGLANAFNAPRGLPEMRRIDLLMDRAVLPGMLSFSKYGYLWRKKSWPPMTDALTGRTAVITGATSGIGKCAALACARLGAKTVIVGRNADKVDSVRREITAETGAPGVRGEVADLSLKKDVRSLAERLMRTEPFIHILVNNAGALFDDRRETAEGVERALAVNLLGPCLLTALLLPKIIAGAPARIINVSSGGMYTQRLAADDLGFERELYDGEKAYARAKRGLAVLSAIWGKRYGPQGVAVNAMHPGWVDTPGINRALPRFSRRTRRILRTPAQGADTIVWLAAAREAATAGGGFWFDRRPHTPYVFPDTRETEEERRRFIAALESLAGTGLTP